MLIEEKKNVLYCKIFDNNIISVGLIGFPWLTKILRWYREKKHIGSDQLKSLM